MTPSFTPIFYKNDNDYNILRGNRGRKGTASDCKKQRQVAKARRQIAKNSVRSHKTASFNTQLLLRLKQNSLVSVFSLHRDTKLRRQIAQWRMQNDAELCNPAPDYMPLLSM